MWVRTNRIDTLKASGGEDVHVLFTTVLVSVWVFSELFLNYVNVSPFYYWDFVKCEFKIMSRSWGRSAVHRKLMQSLWPRVVFLTEAYTRIFRLHLTCLVGFVNQVVFINISMSLSICWSAEGENLSLDLWTGFLICFLFPHISSCSTPLTWFLMLFISFALPCYPDSSHSQSDR
jgi:hypothetical protein